MDGDRQPNLQLFAFLQLLLIFIKKCKANLYSTSKRASFVKFTNKFLWDKNCDKQTLIFYKGLIFFQFFYGLNYKWNKTSPYWHLLQMPQLRSFVSDIVKNFKTDALCLFNLNFICNVEKSQQSRVWFIQSQINSRERLEIYEQDFFIRSI